MIDTAVLPLFFAAAATLLIVPGPDFLLITTQSATRGYRYGIACSSGVLFAGILQTILVAVGFGRAMETWPVVATTVRLGGAIYLTYLGVRHITSWVRRRPNYAPKRTFDPRLACRWSCQQSA